MKRKFSGLHFPFMEEVSTAFSNLSVAGDRPLCPKQGQVGSIGTLPGSTECSQLWALPGSTMLPQQHLSLSIPQCVLETVPAVRRSQW